MILAILVSIILTIIWLLPQYQVNSLGITNPEKRFEAENEARKTIAQIIGGAVILIGLYFSWRTLESQRETLKLQRDDLNATREGQITERFTRAIDQLGSIRPDGKPNLEVRLGGIYALERIATDSPNDHWTVIEILSSYIRENAPISSIDIESYEPPTADIQATINIIGRRNSVYDKTTINLSDVNLRKIDFWKANFRGAFLWGSNFQGANLYNANLAGAYLQHANLEGVFFSETNLKGANLCDATLTESFGLSIEQLCLVKTLYNAKLPEKCYVGGTKNRFKLNDGMEWDYWEGGTEVDCLQAIKERCPELLEKPE